MPPSFEDLEKFLKRNFCAVSYSGLVRTANDNHENNPLHIKMVLCELEWVT